MHRILSRIGGAAVIGPVVVAVAVATAMTVTAAVIDRISFPDHLPVGFWVLAVLAVVADLWLLPLLGTRRRLPTVFFSFAFTFAITLLWGPILGIAVQTVAVAGAAVRLRFPFSWLAFTVARLAAAFGAAGVVLELFGPPPFALSLYSGRPGISSVVLSAATWFMVSYAILAVWLWTHSRSGWRRTFRRTFGNELLATGALLLLAPVLLVVPTVWTILFLMVPVVVVSQFARLSAQREEQLRHDQLTGLLGRPGLATEIEALIDADAALDSSARDGRFALFLLDLDRFKQFNDALGRAVGDRLLVEVARRLTDTVRPGDLVARLGGDEFAVLAPDIVGGAAEWKLAADISGSLALPVCVDGLSLRVDASIGVVRYPDHGHDVTTLLRHADIAMDEAKRASDAIAVYSPFADSSSLERLGLLADLRGALQDPGRRAEIRFHYQPQVAIATGEVVGVEALLRWHHPQRGLVSAEEVVRVAENSRVMQLLTRRAFDDVVGQLGQWNAGGLRLRASINMSVRDLYTTDLVDHLAGLLRDSGVHPGQVQVEMTETALLADPRMVLATSQHLARLGVALALDDLGTGYSSLQHLRRLPLSEVKVDRSFVSNMTTSHDDEVIVRSVIQLAGALGLRVVAEGVENQHTHDMLAAAGCDIGQGWHYAHDMPRDELETWLTGRVWREPPAAAPRWQSALDRVDTHQGTAPSMTTAPLARSGRPSPTGGIVVLEVQPGHMLVQDGRGESPG